MKRIKDKENDFEMFNNFINLSEETLIKRVLTTCEKLEESQQKKIEEKK
ncbi:hypothetical protein ACAG39_06535 [Caldicellulosiruptoraceae bacterium PP1]